MRIEMKRFTQFVAFGNTGCYKYRDANHQYNLKRTKDQRFLSDGISEKDFKKLTPDLMSIGEKSHLKCPTDLH